jgi:hypothetical protein
MHATFGADPLHALRRAESQPAWTRTSSSTKQTTGFRASRSARLRAAEIPPAGSETTFPPGMSPRKASTTAPVPSVEPLSTTSSSSSRPSSDAIASRALGRRSCRSLVGTATVRPSI